MKRKSRIIAAILAVIMLLGVVPTNVFAEDIRIKISNIVATSDTNSIPVYGGTYKRPTFKVTEGKPAYFAAGVAGYWLKKEGENWNPYGADTFTEGTYKYKVRIRIDGWTGTTHVLDSNGVTATVDGKKWADNRIPTVTDMYSYVWTESKEYVIKAPVGTPLGFVKNSIWNIGLNYEGRAIETFSVATGATGGEKPYRFSKVSGPDWINVAGNGTVSGTPNSVGTNEDLVICVTDNKSATAEITLTVAKTVQNPSTRTKISNIVATSDTDSIPVYGGTYKRPTFKVTEGKPAYFREGGAGYWLKKEGEEWNPYGRTTFTKGTYKYKVQIRIDGEAGTTHVLDENGITVTVDGNTWAVNERPSVTDTDSFVWTESEEYVISKTAQEKVIDIPKANTNLVYNGNPQTGVNEGTGYTLTGNTATNAGTYTAKATLDAGYKWRDGSTGVKEISFEIKKAIPTFTEPTGLKGQKGAKLSTVTLPTQFKWKNGDLILNTVGDNTYYATFTPADTTNYEVIDVDLTVTVEDVVTPPEKVTLTTNIINGGGTVTLTPNTATVDKGNKIEVTFNPETNYELGTVTLDGTNVKPQVVSNKLTITMDKSKTLTVTFKEKPITPPPTVQSIKVISTDHKTEYKVGDSLDVTNLKIEATMSDGTKSIIPVTSGMVDGFDSSTAGTKTLTITCQDKTTTFTINVTASSTPPTPPVESIAVNSATHKTAYTKGEALDVTNLTILVTMTDSTTTTKNVTAEMVSGFDPNTEGTQTLTITYEGKKTTYNINVTASSTPPTQYTLTASVDGGHGSVTPPTKTVDKDETVTLTFTPETGYELDTVTVNGTVVGVMSNVLDITMNENKTVVVTFKPTGTPPTPVPVTITFDKNGGNGTMADVTKNKGDSFTLPACTFTPPAGKEFKAWQVDGTEKNVGDNIEVNGDINIKAVWKDIGSVPPTPPVPPTPDKPITPTPEPYPNPWIVYPGWYYNFEAPKPKEEKPVTKMEMDWKIEFAIGTSTIDREINGVDSKIKMDVAPYIRDGRIMLPLRSLAEALGFEVEWNRSTRTVVLKDNNTRVEIPVGTNKIIVNGNVYTSDVKPEIKNNRTMLPIANLARALGLSDGNDIIWNSKSKMVTIYRSIVVK